MRKRPFLTCVLLMTLLLHSGAVLAALGAFTGEAGACLKTAFAKLGNHETAEFETLTGGQIPLARIQNLQKQGLSLSIEYTHPISGELLRQKGAVEKIFQSQEGIVLFLDNDGSAIPLASINKVVIPGAPSNSITARPKPLRSAVSPARGAPTSRHAAGLPPDELEQELTRLSGLETDEVVALIRNFSDTPTFSGETGVFRIDGKVYVDPSLNLINAYKTLYPKIQPGKITPQDITELRRLAIEGIVRNGEWVEPPLRFKSAIRETKAVIQGPVHPDVQARLEHFGLPWKFDPEKNITTITYPQSPGGPPLEKLCQELNSMVQSGVFLPETIVAKAVQDLLILHPFEGGNGRTARLLGQMLFHKLTRARNGEPKSVVFSSLFHREMEVSARELAEDLLRMRPRSDHLTLKQIAETLPETSVMEVPPPPPATLRDRPFGKFKLHGKEYLFDELPVQQRQIEPGKDVYYGRPALTHDEAKKSVRAVFTFGRGEKPNSHPHLSIDHHQNSTKTTDKDYQPSGFFPTTMDPHLALGFASKTWSGARQPKYGIVYVIDPSQAQVLPVYALPNVSYLTEWEVLFRGQISPDRVKSAVLYDLATKKPIEVITNPNYRPRR